MNYVGVKDPEVAKERVKIRVSKGGHGIPDKIIWRDKKIPNWANNILQR